MNVRLEPTTDAALLGVWEQARGRDSLRRALILTEFAAADLTQAGAAELPLGRRDTLLIRWRRQWRGAKAEAYVECPACGEGLEHIVDLDVIEQPIPELDGPCVLEHEAFRIGFRLPTSADIDAMRRVPVEDAKTTLLSRVVTTALRNGDSIGPDRIPAATIEALEAEVERLDPQASIVFNQTCPACDHRFSSPFQIADYLWHEVDVAARRLLREVDGLARAYGWSEAEILSLTQGRRDVYLEMVWS